MTGMIREHPAFDPGLNKILKINRVVQDDPGRKAEDANGATVDPGRAPAKPNSFQKNHDNLR
jgi:hypothetical protein